MSDLVDINTKVSYSERDKEILTWKEPLQLLKPAPVWEGPLGSQIPSCMTCAWGQAGTWVSKAKWLGRAGVWELESTYPAL